MKWNARYHTDSKWKAWGKALTTGTPNPINTPSPLSSCSFPGHGRCSINACIVIHSLSQVHRLGSDPQPKPDHKALGQDNCSRLHLGLVVFSSILGSQNASTEGKLQGHAGHLLPNARPWPSASPWTVIFTNQWWSPNNKNNTRENEILTINNMKHN